MHVLIIGHSISRRLRHHLFPTANNSSIPTFLLLTFLLKSLHKGGHTRGSQIILFHHHIHAIPQGTQVVFFSMGTNDLCAGAQPGAVAAQLYFHALRCLNLFGVHLVFIDHTFPRATSLYPGFTAFVALAQIISMGSNPRVILSKHQIDRSIQPHPFARDRVHLSPRGIRRYARNIRGALPEAQRLLT